MCCSVIQSVWDLKQSDGSENALVHCAKELPAFTIPYGNDDSDEHIFNSDNNSDSGCNDENEGYKN